MAGVATLGWFHCPPELERGLGVRSRELLCAVRGRWISHESWPNQSRTESFRPVYRLNLRAVLVTFAESSGISGADGIARWGNNTRRRENHLRASRSLENTVHSVSPAQFPIANVFILRQGLSGSWQRTKPRDEERRGTKEAEKDRFHADNVLSTRATLYANSTYAARCTEVSDKKFIRRGDYAKEDASFG